MNQQIKEALKILTDAMEEKFAVKKPYVVIDGVAPQFVEEVLEKVPDSYSVRSVWTQSQPVRNQSGIINGRPVQAGVQLQTFVFILLERVAFEGGMIQGGKGTGKEMENPTTKTLRPLAF